MRNIRIVLIDLFGALLLAHLMVCTSLSYPISLAKDYVYDSVAAYNVKNETGETLAYNRYVDWPIKEIQEINSLPDEPGLGFPFEPFTVINELMSFGIPAWGPPEEDHFGIDLIPRYQSSFRPFLPANPKVRKVKVVAPTEGTIRGIFALDADIKGTKDISVILEMNSNWSITPIEP